MAEPIFKRLALIGIGLIGSSVARIAMEKRHLAAEVVANARTQTTLDRVRELGIADRVELDPARAVAGADCVMLCAPVGAYAALAEAIAPHLAPGAIVTDVGSTKQSVIRDVGPLIPAGVHFVPAHPVAGTEYSGPDSGFTTRQDVLKFAASGFRDFTRIAASDPVMWRDIFLNNREALLEMLARFMEDAQAMARAVRWGDPSFIEDSIQRGRVIRRNLIELKQA